MCFVYYCEQKSDTMALGSFWPYQKGTLNASTLNYTIQ